jgi:hypothetical protein
MGCALSLAVSHLSIPASDQADGERRCRCVLCTPMQTRSPDVPTVAAHLRPVATFYTVGAWTPPPTSRSPSPPAPGPARRAARRERVRSCPHRLSCAAGTVPSRPSGRTIPRSRRSGSADARPSSRCARRGATRTPGWDRVDTGPSGASFASCRLLLQVTCLLGHPL